MTISFNRYVSNRCDILWFGIAALGLTACLVLTGTFDTILATRLAVAQFDFRVGGVPLSGNAACVVACLLCAVAAWTMRGSRQSGWTLTAVLCVCQMLACLALFCFGSNSDEPLSVAAWYVLSAASTVQLVLWAQALVRVGRERALALFGCSLLLDCLLSVAGDVLPTVPVVALLLVASIYSPIALYAFQHATNTRPELFAGAAEENARRPVEAIPLALSVFSLILYGIAVGCTQSMGNVALYSGISTTVQASNGAATSPVLVQVSTAAVAVALIVLSAFFGRLRHVDALLRTCLLAVLMAAVYVTGVLGTVGTSAGMVATSAVRTLAFAYVWLLACEPLPHPTRAAFVFSVGWGAFTFSHTFSTKVGLAVTAQATAEMTVAFVAYNVLVIAGLVGIAVINAHPQLKDLVISKHPDVPADDRMLGEQLVTASNADAYERGSAILAREFNLTAREADVLLPLVRGRSNSGIAAALGVGSETIHTHVRHIYQKTGIHSREELMDTVERLAGEVANR